MKDKEKIKILIEALETIEEDAEMALNKSWDKDDDGFEAQIELINQTFNLIK